MLHRHLLRIPPYLLPSSSCRYLSFTQRNRLLSREFALNEKWAKRVDDLQQYKLGGSYEWITSVQKKFVGDGKASAVDVDSAICLAQEEDQQEDAVELVYKLRHTENTADLLESTEYGLVRFLLRWNNTQLLFKVLNDPINYGIFMNEHTYCLAIDHMLKQENITGAAEIATIVMKQEFFDSELVNLLSVYSLLKWLELPAEQRLFDNKPKQQEEPEEGEHVMEDDEITFKFPFLRPEFNDGHFDLEDPMQLVRKSLEWFRPHLKDEWTSDLDTLLQQLREHQTEEPFKCEAQLSDKVFASLESSKKGLEAKPVEKQTKLFDDWRNRRHELIETQARTLNLQIRLEELKSEEEKARAEIELLQFFDNRIKWESTAKEKTELFEQLKIGQISEELSEEVYAKTMFDRMRDRVSQNASN